MSEYTRRSRPNNRFRIRFYTPSIETEASGELRKAFNKVSSGYFAMEKPLKPQEVSDGDRNINEQSFLLIGQWTKSLAAVTHGMLAYNPTTDTVYAVNGNATDPWGDRKKIHIYVVDNLSREVVAGDFKDC